MLCLTRGPMPKIHPSITRALTIAMLMTSAFADTVTLKSGEHIEGKITKETEKDVTIETRSGGIVDERTVLKTEIQKIDKTSPEMVAFSGIERIKLQDNSFPAAQYDPYIAALEAFVKQFPDSGHTKDAQAMLDAFQAEKKRVENGEVKIDGNWLSRAEVEREKVQIGGRMAFNYMKAQSAAADFVGALNAFTSIEKTYPGTATTPDAIELALKIIPLLRAQVDRAIPEQKVLQDQRDKGIKAAGPTDRAEMEAAVKREDEATEAAIKAAESGGRWAPFVKTNAKSLASLQKRAENEEKRLTGLAAKVPGMRESLQATEAAKQKISSGDLAGADADLKNATKLWSANELAKRLAGDVATQKRAASDSASAAPAPVATPQPKAKTTPKPSTPRPSAGAAQAAAPVASKGDEEDKPFYMTIPGAASIVVGLAVVLGGANFFLKMKKRKAEEAQG